MTVGELIEKLGNLPKDTEVLAENEGMWEPVNSIELWPNDNGGVSAYIVAF